jgi:pimeloyl-ACP methyl ester carboxylesterase
VSCPHLFIKGTESLKYMSEENYERLLKVYQNNNPNFVYRCVPGGHHLHLNDPEAVAPLLNEFLLKDFATGGANDGDAGQIPFDLV